MAGDTLIGATGLVFRGNGDLQFNSNLLTLCAADNLVANLSIFSLPNQGIPIQSAAGR